MEIRLDPRVTRRFPHLERVLRAVAVASEVPLDDLTVEVVSGSLQVKVLESLLSFQDPRGLRISAVHAHYQLCFAARFEPYWLLELDVDCRRCRSYRRIAHFFAHELGHHLHRLEGTLTHSEAEEQSAEAFARRILAQVSLPDARGAQHWRATLRR